MAAVNVPVRITLTALLLTLVLCVYIYHSGLGLLDESTLPLATAEEHDEATSRITAYLHGTNASSSGSPPQPSSTTEAHENFSPSQTNASLNQNNSQPADQMNRPVLINEEEHDESPRFNSSLHRKLYSLSTADRKYFDIDFGDQKGYNPNILPDPSNADVYFVFASELQTTSETPDHRELFCRAKFTNEGTLRCLEKTEFLPVELSEGHCEGDLEVFNFRKGPRDPRVLYGPERPYNVYGSLGTHSCLGMFVQDLGSLVTSFSSQTSEDNDFTNATEMQRPPPHKNLEKNWFLFWDSQGQTHVHQDFAPNRSYTQLFPDGGIGPNMSPEAEKPDGACMARYIPLIEDHVHEAYHQATNSLAITLCKRSDSECTPSDNNTFIMAIFQLKTYYHFHPQYYPYVMLFKRDSPFALHAISEKSLWIHGRGPITSKISNESVLLKGGTPPHDVMFYVTSMSWKSHDQRYHGYIDDVLLVSFGIEDTNSGTIDVLAGDLFKDLGYCEKAQG